MCAQNVLLLAAVLLLLRSTSAEVSLTPQQQQIYEALLPLHMADVPVTEQQPNTCASSDEDMEQLYKDNLHPDIEAWKSRKLSVAASLERLLQQKPENDVLKLILIKDNQVYFPLQKHSVTECETPCNIYLHRLVRALRTWARKGTGNSSSNSSMTIGTSRLREQRLNSVRERQLQGTTTRKFLAPTQDQGSTSTALFDWPDGLYYISVGDWPQCGYAWEAKQRCAAPILSQIKKVNTSSPGNREVGLDILIPVPPENRRTLPLLQFPWDKKASRAFWRGTPFCSGAKHRHVRCSRAGVSWPMSKSGADRVSGRASSSNPATGSGRVGAASTSRRSSRQPIGARQQQGRHLTAATTAGTHATGPGLSQVHSSAHDSDASSSSFLPHESVRSAAAAQRQVLQGRRQQRKRRRRRRRRMEQQTQQKAVGAGAGAPLQARKKLLAQERQQEQHSQLPEDPDIGRQHLGARRRQKNPDLGRKADGRALRTRTRSTPYPQDAHSAAMQLPRFPFTRISDHARYKFLVHMDGITASYRLYKLMHADSPVLKQDSPYGEHFSRSLKPYTHYIPIFKDAPDDVFATVRHYLDVAHDTELKQIASNAQQFVSRYLCPRARMLYLHAALRQYKGLFPDMDEEVKRKWWPMVQAKLKSRH